MQGRPRTRIVVVRHGQAEPKKGWTGPDDLRPLTRRGRRQAERLGKVVPGRPDRILSSPALRCCATVGPLSDLHGVGVEITDALATDAGDGSIELCLKLAHSEPAGALIVLCTHRETMMRMLPALSPRFGGKLSRRLPGAKGGAWVLAFEDGRVATIDYRPPAA